MEVIARRQLAEEGPAPRQHPLPGQRGGRLLPDQGSVVRRRPRPPRRHRAEDPARLPRGERFDAGPRLRPGRWRRWPSAASRRRTAKVALLGFAFKSNSGDCRFTPVAPLVAGCAPPAATSRICDPMVTAAEATHHGVALEPDWRDGRRGGRRRPDPRRPRRVHRDHRRGFRRRSRRAR